MQWKASSLDNLRHDTIILFTCHVLLHASKTCRELHSYLDTNMHIVIQESRDFTRQYIMDEALTFIITK